MTASRISEELFYPSDPDKMKLLLTLMEEEGPDKAIVFANTKHSCEKVHAWLEADGHRVGLLTGDVIQKKRLKNFRGLYSGGAGHSGSNRRCRPWLAHPESQPCV